MSRAIRLYSLGFFMIVALGIVMMSPASAPAGCFLSPLSNYDRYQNIYMCEGLLGQLLGAWSEVKCAETGSPRAPGRRADATLETLFTEPRVVEFRYLPF